MRWFRPILLLFTLLAGAGLARAADKADNVVALPPFLVEETSKGPPWRYGAIDGFEILSRCHDVTTRDLTSVYFRLHQLLDLVLPEELRLRYGLPRAMIYCDEDQVPSAASEVVDQMLKRTPGGMPVDDEPVFGSRGRFVGGGTRRVSFVPNLRLNDRDAMAVLVIVQPGAFEPETLVLTPEYVAYLVRGRTPTLPPWFSNGFLSLFTQMKFHDGQIDLKPGTWVSEAATSALRGDPKKAPAPLPFEDFFGLGRAAKDTLSTDQVLVWNSQSEFFVRWALDPKAPARRQALWKFVDLASREAVTEAKFQNCFGLDYATAQAQFAASLPAAVRQTVRLQPPKKIKEPTLVLRDAEPAEVARIKGDWERLEVPFVKARLPELAPKYLEQARRTLLRAYDHGERDRRLLTSLGLCECDAGNDAGARGYLEAAAALGDLRPRANYELARLRLAEAHGHPGGTEGRLTAGQVADVLTPLFAARQQLPPLPEVYTLIAKTWSSYQYRPTRRNLAVLDEGVALFPRDVELVYQTALANAHANFAPEVKFYVDLGLRIAPNNLSRARFTKLQAQQVDASAP